MKGETCLPVIADVSHGLRDDALEIEDTRQQVKKLQSTGLPVQWVELDKEHEIEEEVEMPLIRHWVRQRYRRPTIKSPRRGL